MNGILWRVEWRCYVIELRKCGVLSLAYLIADVWTQRLLLLWGSAVILGLRCIGWLYGIDWRDSA
jgi:hypothetical protein